MDALFPFRFPPAVGALGQPVGQTAIPELSAVESPAKSAATGKIGDGKIFSSKSTKQCEFARASAASTRSDRSQRLICIPSSTTRSGGMPKYWVADRELREMKEKSALRHRNILLSPVVSSVSRPRK